MIDYKTNHPISVKQFIELLNKNNARRPPSVRRMKTRQHVKYQADFINVTAWDGERLVGVARSVTDFGLTAVSFFI